MNGTVLVRAPSSRLAEGIVTHISRAPVDVALARAQHAGYADALAACGWMIRQAPAAEDCPDSVFIEDTVVVCEDLAVLARPGAPGRHRADRRRVLDCPGRPRGKRVLRGAPEGNAHQLKLSTKNS